MPDPQKQDELVADADFLLLAELLAQQERGYHFSARERRNRWQEIDDAVTRFEERESAKRRAYREVAQEPEKVAEPPVPLPEYKPKPKRINVKAAVERMEAHQKRIAWLEAEIAKAKPKDDDEDDEILWLLAA